jgi:hypothetical protein
VTAGGFRGPWVGQTVGPPVIVRGGLAYSSPRTVVIEITAASGSVNRCLRFLARSDPTTRPGS